jgi:hypothetical protein
MICRSAHLNGITFASALWLSLRREARRQARAEAVKRRPAAAAAVMRRRPAAVAAVVARRRSAAAEQRPGPSPWSVLVPGEEPRWTGPLPQPIDVLNFISKMGVRDGLSFLEALPDPILAAFCGFHHLGDREDGSHEMRCCLMRAAFMQLEA